MRALACDFPGVIAFHFRVRYFNDLIFGQLVMPNQSAAVAMATGISKTRTFLKTRFARTQFTNFHTKIAIGTKMSTHMPAKT